MNVLSAIRERALSWVGHVARMEYKEICAKALSCRGLHWWRWRQFHWKEMEKDKWFGPHPQRFKNLQVGGHGGGRGLQVHWKCRRFFGISSDIHGLAALCSRPWALETVCEIWKVPCLGVARCLGDPCVSSMAWTGAAWKLWRRMVSFGVECWSRPRIWTTERVTESVRFGEHLLPLSVFQARLDLVWMSSWYRAGYGWLVTDCSENGRRSGSRGRRSADEWFCAKCRMEPWLVQFFILSVEVLSWNVVRDLFLLQISMLTAWELKSGSEWRTRAFQAWKAVLPGQARKIRETWMDGSCWRASRWTAVGVVVPMASRWLRWRRWLRWSGGAEW